MNVFAGQTYFGSGGRCSVPAGSLPPCCAWVATSPRYRDVSQSATSRGLARHRQRASATLASSWATAARLITAIPRVRPAQTPMPRVGSSTSACTGVG